jgi:hypothetical protein
MNKLRRTTPCANIEIRSREIDDAFDTRRACVSDAIVTHALQRNNHALPRAWREHYAKTAFPGDVALAERRASGVGEDGQRRSPARFPPTQRYRI